MDISGTVISEKQSSSSLIFFQLITEYDIGRKAHKVNLKL